MKPSLRLALAAGCALFALFAMPWAAPASGAPDGVAFSPISSFPKEFPRFFTPITGIVVTMSSSQTEPVPICLPNTDQSRSTLAPGVGLTLFGRIDGEQAWSAIGDAHVSDDGEEICADEGVGVGASGLYVVALRTSDLASELPDIVQDLGDANPAESTGLFCNAVTEFVCNQGCLAAYRARLSLGATQFLTCQLGCSNVRPSLRPACRVRCSNASALYAAGALSTRRQCRDDCACR